MNINFLKGCLIGLAFLVPSIGFAQDYITLSGYQKRGNMGRNAEIKSSPVVLKQSRKIISISGYNAGFWISNGQSIVARYYKQNDRSAIGLVLAPGTYYAYPNLGMRQDSGRVVIRLK